MDHLNDFPKRSVNRDIETKAKAAFETLIAETSCFDVQGSDVHDNGVDYEIEVYDLNHSNNSRIQVQLKGTEGTPNADDSVSVQISRPNLNYLLAQPYSFYACYHVPSNRLFYRTAESVLKEYEHSGKDWAKQDSITVNFSQLLGEAELASLAKLATAQNRFSRQGRAKQVVASPSELARLLRASVPDLNVPAERVAAAEMLDALYHAGEDLTISAHFQKFAAVIGADHPAMLPAYMAETNLGMAGRSAEEDRIRAGLIVMGAALDAGICQPGGLLYSMGNGFTALGLDERAIEYFTRALEAGADADEPSFRAQILKNLGTSIGKLGRGEEALDYYRQALMLNAALPEAQNALGNHEMRAGNYQEALSHFDKAIFPAAASAQNSAVSGWRVNALFNLGDGRAAFRELFRLLSDADREPWIWAWCARQVAAFGRQTVDNALSAVTFWIRFLEANPDDEDGNRELLLAKLFLRSNGQDIGQSFSKFGAEFESLIDKVSTNSVAQLWDRLGHWAQDEENWVDAERCFRNAYDLEGGHYGYCLGTALNFLGRFEESLPILLIQAQSIQPDDMSWFQVATAYRHLDMIEDSILAFEKAIEINPEYALAWFELGGVCWNNQMFEDAITYWTVALEKFPDHELAVQLRTDQHFSQIFGEDQSGAVDI